MLKFKISKHNLMMFTMVLFCLGVIFSFSVGNTSAASPIYVSTHGNNSWNGQNSTWINGTLNGPKATIKNATGTVSSGGTVYIANGTYNENNITINKDMTVIGASQSKTVINGTHTNVIFSISPEVKFTISNLTLTEGDHAIYNYGGNCTVNNCTFTGNSAGAGGAVYTDDAIFYHFGQKFEYAGILNVTGSTFKDNTATTDEVTGGLGGAIYNSASLTATGSNFTGNMATDDGGAIFNSIGSNSTIISSKFTNNSATNDGGAIYNEDSNLTVMKSTLTGNIATNSSGGAIYNSGTLNVSGSTFTSNTAVNGGAIYNDVDITWLVNNSTFTNNTATNKAIIGSSGGAIFNGDGTLKVNNSIFKDNTATDIGGAIRNLGTCVVTNSIFRGNTATANGGGAIFNEGTLTVKGSNFTGNDATKGAVGGAIFNTGGTLNVTGSTFIDNTAAWGGAINNSGNATLHFNQIVGNTAKKGNAIYNVGSKVNATLNWWGYNLGVNVAKQIYNTDNGSVSYNPWIILTINASPASVKVGGNTTITTELLYSFNGSKVVYQNPKYGVVPYAGYANFKATNGIIKNVKFVNGRAVSTLTKLSKVAIVSATVDNLTVKKEVTIN
jgi:autotransporter family porin